MGKPLLEASRIAKTYYLGPGVELEVLKGASMSVAEGEFVAVMGSSGSGKSTLLHIIGALDRPTSGTVAFQDRQLFERPDAELDQLRCACFGFVFQFYHLLPELTVLENVLFPQMIKNTLPGWFTNGSAAKQRCRELLKEVGLQQRMRHRPNQLSGGERQRVAIARALANGPAVLLADEPTGNLDKRTGVEVMRLLTRLHNSGQTIIMVTHDPEVAKSADRILRLEDGRLRQERAPEIH